MCILRECVRVLALLHLCCFINLLLNHYIRHIRILFSLPPSLDPNPNISLSLANMLLLFLFCFVVKGNESISIFFCLFSFSSLSLFVSNVFDWRAFRKIWKLSFFHAVIVASLHCHLQRKRFYLSLSHLFFFSIDCFYQLYVLLYGAERAVVVVYYQKLKWSCCLDWKKSCFYFSVYF